MIGADNRHVEDSESDRPARAPRGVGSGLRSELQVFQRLNFV